MSATNGTATTDSGMSSAIGYDRCRHTPLCLSPIYPDDDVRLTDVGFVLVDHLDPQQAYPQESLFDVQSVAS